MRFFAKLNFTSANEDGASELMALCQTPPRRLLCLTGSGARPLDMLLGDAREVIALDLNPFQNELLRLKIAAFRMLGDADLLCYLGIAGETQQRKHLHTRVASALPEGSCAFWARQTGLIADGIWYAGLWEKVLRLGARGNRLLRGGHIDRLFASASLEEQSEIWARHFDDRIWRASIRMLGRRWFWTRVIGEPGGAFLHSPKDVEQRLSEAFNHAARTFFFRDSDFASLILRGRHEAPRALPLHLAPEHTGTIRQRLDRIRIVDGGLHQLAALGLANIDSFSLSDFGSYCTPAAYEACWTEVRAAATPGARVCEREFMNALPMAAGVRWDGELSKLLTARDKSFIYRIRAGTIDGGTAA